MSRNVVARMWEARLEPGAHARAADWLVGRVVPEARRAGALSASVFTATEDAAAGQPARAVVVTRWHGPPAWVVPAAPAGLVARFHQWDFDEVHSEGGLGAG